MSVRLWSQAALLMLSAQIQKDLMSVSVEQATMEMDISALAQVLSAVTEPVTCTPPVNMESVCVWMALLGQVI